jgi:type III restriction enzyme
VNFELLPFQSQASNQIAARYILLASDRRRPMEYAAWATPFYQALSALTGAGKTPILADAVAQMRAHMSLEPVVLWVSKSRAVVEQTLGNFQPGGKYEGLVEGFVVEPLSQVHRDMIADASQALIALATVGSFNQQDRGDGTLKIHQVALDTSDASLWTALTKRGAEDGGDRRPLIVVYDEGQNLSDQQTELLLELEPDAILVASATMRTPARLGQVINRLTQNGWTTQPLHDESLSEPQRSLVTAIRSVDAVDAGLVKRQIILGGYSTEMETALGDMIAEFGVAETKAKALDAGFLPKAIYVCRTNITQDDGTADVVSRPFAERRAPPIIIWRYLVEIAGVDPAQIAVYLDLKVDRKGHPLPTDFNLFSGGEDDFAAFTAGNYRHIIFNQSLQEGWDDPSCCFAYIDKSMGSAIQVEQVIGRVLRQPGARHYPDPDLNTANFFLRVDDRQEFEKTLRAVQMKIAAELPEVRLEGFVDGRERARARLEPRYPMDVPEIHIDADDAVQPMADVVARLPDYGADSINSQGPGEQVRAVQAIGDGSNASVTITAREHSNRVVARWLVRRTMQSLYPEAVKTIDWADPRFEARVEITSRAASHLRAEAESMVDAYLSNADLAFEATNPYRVGSVTAKPDQIRRFENSVHEGYSDLNTLEIEIAEALDATGFRWARNPSNGGYSIPLLEKGSGRRFFPDFLVWKDDLIYAIDPKGAHLIGDDAGRKLLAIRDERKSKRVIVRLITEGRWSHEPIKKLGGSGYSLWKITNSGQVRASHISTVGDVVRRSLDL